MFLHACDSDQLPGKLILSFRSPQVILIVAHDGGICVTEKRATSPKRLLLNLGYMPGDSSDRVTSPV